MLATCKSDLGHTCFGTTWTNAPCMSRFITYYTRLLEPCRHCSHLLEHQRPWILWLQGGPGASGVGYGNMAEIGPYTAPYWLPRAHSWADVADLVFVDNPVGTGFSYVTNSSLYGAPHGLAAVPCTTTCPQPRPTTKSAPTC